MRAETVVAAVLMVSLASFARLRLVAGASLAAPFDDHPE
jgi:hypothetical protein